MKPKTIIGTDFKSRLLFYLKLFFYTFRLSAFTFGGGYVIVPLMKEQFVDKLHWIDEDEMLDYAAIAQSSPGSMSVNASILIGYNLAGIVGALITVAATVTPPLILLSVISLFYEAFSENEVVRSVLHGMQSGVCAVIISVVTDMSAKIIKKRNILDIALIVLSFTAVFFFNINVIFVVLACAVIGILRVYRPLSLLRKGDK